MEENLVYYGKIIKLEPILGADFIESATAVCGKGGKWRGVVKKGEFEVDSTCVVFMPDTLFPVDCPGFEFMKASGWRVKMRRFKGSPSEALITPALITHLRCEVGDDLTGAYVDAMGISKYMKPVPANLNGDAIGYFPQFIPKTDEPNYQRSEELIELLNGKPYHVTLKIDGSSTTAYRYKNVFGVCSRNLELKFNPNNGYWKVAMMYDLQNKLPEGIALQWETAGPGVQGNPLDLKELDGFAFSAYDIENNRYLDLSAFWDLCKKIGFPMAEVIKLDQSFDPKGLELYGEGKYSNGKEREGVVVRSNELLLGHKPVSFKVINLRYET